MNDKRDWLISELRKIEENQYKVPDVQIAWNCIPLMLDCIGDLDPDIRDNLIYTTLCEWIYEKEYFNEEQLRYILSTLMDENHLFYQLGSVENNSVFTRTFSVLGVVLILYRHRKKSFLSIDEFKETKNKLIKYYTLEKDLRGYLQELGWAHGAAHGADAMDELVQCSESSESDIQEVLDAIKAVMYNEKYIFHNEEDERIARIVFRIIKDKLISQNAMIKWLEGLSECSEWQRDRVQYIARVNAKNFIRCLYFKVKHYDNALDIIDAIFKSEEKLNRFLQVDKELLKKIT